MGNMGTIPAVGYESSVVQTFSSPTGTSHTMTYAAGVNDMVLVINNVIQEPTVAYTTSGTTLTTDTLVSGDTMYIIFLALTRQTSAPGADTVTNAMIVDNAINSEHYTDGSIDLAHMSVNSIDSDQYVDASIDNAHLADDAVGVAELSATGTASSSTFLRGDNAWAAAGGGALTYISSVSASSSATVDFLSSFSSTYDDYVVHYNNVNPATDHAQPWARIAVGGTAQSGASDYAFGFLGYSEAAATLNGNTTGTTNIRLADGIGNASGESASGSVWFRGVNNTANNKFIMWDSTELNDGNVVETYVGGGGFMASTLAWSGCQFLLSSGNITSGDFHLYGVAKS